MNLKMKYYIHKETNEPLAIMDGMFVLHSDKTAIGYPTLPKSYDVVYLAVFPNRSVGNGIVSHLVTFHTLQKFKRVNKQKFAELCPDFGQFRHKNDNGENRITKYHELLHIKNRKESFGG